MSFSKPLKVKVRKKAHLMCCLCKEMGVEVHHIIPQEDAGPDTEDNAAPLCPTCHETYGANPKSANLFERLVTFGMKYVNHDMLRMPAKLMK